MTYTADVKRQLIRYWMPLVLWCAGIFVQSSHAIPDVFPHWPYVDKIGHTAVYALLSILFCRAFNSIPAWRGKTLKLFTAGIILTTLYGVSDEWHQSFVAARTADAMDLLADMGGAFLGACLFVWIGHLRMLSAIWAHLNKYKKRG